MLASDAADEYARQAHGSANFCDLLCVLANTVDGTITARDTHANSIRIQDFTVHFTSIDFYNREESTTDPLLEIQRSLEKELQNNAILSRDRPISETPKDFDGGYRHLSEQLLFRVPLSPHETFLHPVICIILVMSNEHEVDSCLLSLFTKANQAYFGPHVNTDYLKYYLMVRPPDGDVVASEQAFERMKRSFGLHCHLLKFSGEGELLEKQQYHRAARIHQNDDALVLAMLAEMVQQSLVPHMERCINNWNEEFAAGRRGITGRFLNVSRRLGFGLSRSNTPAPAASGNYISQTGIYPLASPEHQMRRLADYSFMLRDWRLAHSIYDILRKDFANDKAWKYHAGAQEMSAMSLLLQNSYLSEKARTDSLDLMLDSASYSYLSRCSAPYFGMRTLFAAVELLDAKPEARRDATKWATRILESGILNGASYSMVVQRISRLYEGRQPRKAAFWSVLACESWITNEYYEYAQVCLDNARAVYMEERNWTDVTEFLQSLQMQVDNRLHKQAAEVSIEYAH